MGKKEKSILLMNMPSSVKVYSKSKIKAAIGVRPFVSLAALGAYLEKNKCKVQVIDLMLSLNPLADLKKRILEFKPSFIGITFTTPLYTEARILSRFIKANFPEITIIAGGVHPTIYPEEVLKNMDIDFVVVGEGEVTLTEIIEQKKPLSKINGLVYKKNNKIIKNKSRDYIKNLDDLPFPAWHLFDIQKYQNPRITARKNPVGTIETSRGCVYRCTYCNKQTFGRLFRTKSSMRE